MTQPEIFLVRHGETEWNRANRYQGQLDSPLTENGREQARAVGRRLDQMIEDWPGLVTFCSPLGRCRETAQMIAATSPLDESTIVYDDRLKECQFGIWEGRTKAEVAAEFAKEMRAREADRWHHAAPGGGETYPDLQARVRSWQDELGRRRPVLVICHGMLGKVLRGLFLGLTPEGVMAQDEPQGVVMHLKDGAETWFEGVY